MVNQLENLKPLKNVIQGLSHLNVMLIYRNNYKERYNESHRRKFWLKKCLFAVKQILSQNSLYTVPSTASVLFTK